MNHRVTTFIKQNGIYYLFGFLALFAMKYFYSRADSDALIWILSPTARWVTTLSGIDFVYEPGAGYLNDTLHILIAPACSGVQFMMIVLATLLFSFVHRMGFYRYGRMIWTLTNMVIIYPLTILVNGLRIIIAIYLPPFFTKYGLYGEILTPKRLHTAIGVVVYFSALLAIHRSAEIFVSHLTLQYSETSNLTNALHLLQPVFWYFLLVLGIPFLNRAYAKNGAAFTEYALLVSFLCGVVLLSILLLTHIRHRVSSDMNSHVKLRSNEHNIY